MFKFRGNSVKRAVVLMICFMMTFGLASCGSNKSEKVNQDEVVVESTAAPTENSKKEKTDKKEDKSDKDKSDKNKSDNKVKSDNADKNTAKNSDKKTEVKSDKNDAGRSSGNTGGGSYSGYSGPVTQYVEQPKAEAPKPEEPKTEAPKPEEPKAEEPKTEEPKPEEPKTEEPKTEEPKPEEPKTEEPKTEEPKPEEPKTEEPKPEDPKKEEDSDPVLELSGNPDDVITVEENSYYEGDKFYLFVGKNCEIRGDIADRLSSIMNELEDLYSLRFSDYYDRGDSDWREYYFDGAFEDINKDCSKVNIMIVDDPEDGSVEWASYNVMMLFDDDMIQFPDVVYHELTHVLRIRQSEQFSSVFEEGVATYSQYIISKNHNEEVWTIFIYTRDDGFIYPFDESPIFNDAEQAYRDIEAEDRDIYQKDYQYGFRFITFLTEEYGQNVIKDISRLAFENNLDYGDIDGEISVIKQATSEDVFEKFSAWLPEGWDRFTNEYNDYMSQFE